MMLRAATMTYSMPTIGIVREQGSSSLEDLEICGADRDRTDDLRLAKPALSQLSYSPVLERAGSVYRSD